MTEKQNTLKLVEQVNQLLLEGEPHNVSVDTYSDYSSVKQHNSGKAKP